MEINKVLGYILLAVGLLLILIPLYQTYAIFTGKAMPPQVFKSQKIEVPAQSNNPFDVGQQVQQALVKVLPIDLIHNTLNLVSWMILMWILMFGGSKIASLGIALIK